jgi:hypothetical protein
MKRKSEIEATLERSLRSQVKTPPLDSNFDAKVWARIESAAQPAISVVPAMGAVLKAGRWLNILNVAGLAAAAVFVSFFGAQMLAGADIAISLPEISTAATERIVMETGNFIAGAAILFGLWFTPWGRRLRAELS